MALHDRVETLIREMRYRQVMRYVQSCTVFVDLGCGKEHHFLRRIKDRVTKCWGFDIEAPGRVEQNLTLLQCDITQPLLLADGMVDQVSILAAIEHLEEPISVFRECYRILRPLGRLIVTTPSWLGIKLHEILQKTGLVRDVAPGEHIDFGMSKQLLGNWVNQCGFEVETLKSFELGINLLVVARKPSFGK
jgi:SAM-dependent methyltransferase